MLPAVAVKNNCTWPWPHPPENGGKQLYLAMAAALAMAKGTAKTTAMATRLLAQPQPPARARRAA